jgi:hypothetical protein
MNVRIGPWLLVACGLAAGLAAPGFARAHGSIVAEDDRCLITMGYLQAHFKIYLPRSRGHTEFCEDLPAGGEAVFVMEYLHEALGSLPIEFRIIRNATGLGRFTRLADIAGPDLETHTVFHQRAAVAPDVFTALHVFDVTGDYVGIVTVPRPGTDEPYTAVFPFTVGYAGFAFWPWFAVFILLVAGILWSLLQRESSPS